MAQTPSREGSEVPQGNGKEKTINTRGTNTKKEAATNEAWKFMIEEGYLKKGQELTGGTVATVLRQGIDGTKERIPAALKKFLGHLTEVIESGNMILVEERLHNATDTIEEATKALEEMKEKAVEAYVDTERIIQAELRDELKEFMTQYTEENQELRKEMRELTERVQELQTTSDRMGATRTTINNTNTEKSPSTYAAALARELTKPAHREAIQREERKRKQIWVKLSKDAGTETFMKLGEMELTQKANETLKAIKSKEQDKPSGIKFVGAIKTKLNLVILQLESIESSRWIEQTEVMNEFTNKFGLWAECKTATSNIILEFIPLMAEITDDDVKREIETFNGLPRGSIASARWLKNPQNRAPTQTVGHAELGISTPETANKILRDGITIRGRHVSGRKAIPTPIRCNKCQKYGHIARDCKAGPKCAICAREHNTQECDSEDDIRTCANCGDTGHGAASRDCHYLKDKIKELEERRPELKYIFYPIKDEDWTWTRADGKSATIEFRNERGDGELEEMKRQQIRREQEHMRNMNLGTSWEDDTEGLDLGRDFMNRRMPPKNTPTEPRADRYRNGTGWTQTTLPFGTQRGLQNPPPPQNTPPALPHSPPRSQRSNGNSPRP